MAVALNWRTLSGLDIRVCAVRRLRRLSAGVSTIVLLLTTPSASADWVPLDRYPVETYNFYGQPGLLDMPTADINPDGEMAATVAFTPTNDRYNLDFAALPWLETTFRYSRIDRWNTLFGLGGDLYDRSLSVRARLSEEDADWPSVSIGLQDILGTGAYGGEYLVASKHVGALEFTGGIGWRRFGGTLTFTNPIGYILPSFKAPAHFDSTGVPLLNQFFHGPNAGVFGGISWKTPIRGLSLILELSGDKYTRETEVGSIHIKSQINLGFSYEPWAGMQVGGGWLYGSQFGLRVSFFANPFDEPFTSRMGAPPTSITVRPADQRNAAELTALQDYTHFYDDWPSDNGWKLGGSHLGYPTLSDVLYSTKAFLSSQVVESYGNSLILEASRGTRADCSEVTNILGVANAAGFKEVVLSTTGDPTFVKICPTASIVERWADAIPSPASFTTSNDSDAAPLPESDGAASESVADPDAIKKAIIREASDQGIAITGYLQNDHSIEIAFANLRYRTDTEAIGRLARILMKNAPYTVTDFRFVGTTLSIPERAVVLHRANIERVYNLSGSAQELLADTEMSAVSDNDPLVESGSLLEFPKFNYFLSPGYHQSLFDPDNPFRYGIYMGLGGGAAISRNLAFTASFEANIYNNFNTITRTSDSVLPHVRSDFAQYLKHGSSGISSLMAQYMTKFSPEVYFLGRAGYLEDMYGGIGGEVLWRPENRRYSFGAALYAVQQRNYNRLFGFRDYKTLTGHISMYYESPFHGLDFELHVGRYLAGDYGATFQLTRRFDSGIEIGAYATLTNVPFSKFGEGSFDKGFIIHIPLDYLVPVNTQDEMRLDFSPLTRDGGQRLAGEESLFYLTRSMAPEEILPTWNKVLEP